MKRTISTRPLFAIGVATLLASSASAQTYPYYVGVIQTVSHDDYMRRYGGTGSDWISATGLRLGIDQAFGRQQLIATVAGNMNRYRHNTQLNHNDYRGDLRLNWSSDERLSGFLAVNAGRSLGQNGLSSTSQIGGVNQIRTEGWAFQAQLGSVTVWSFDAGVTGNRQRNSNANFQQRDLDQSALSLGARWAPTPDFSVRLGGRTTHGKLPNYAGGGDTFRRNDIDLTTNAVLSGASSVNARLGVLRERHTAANARDSRGWNGSLGWNWQPSGLSSFALTYIRDSSLGAVDATSSTLGSVFSTDTRIGNTLALSNSTQLTGKVKLNTRLGYTRRTVDNSYATASAPAVATSGRDTSQSFAIGLRYEALRNLDLGCNYAVDHRSSSSALVVSYTSHVVSCFGQAYLR